MSKFKGHADKTSSIIGAHTNEVVENFMGGNSYRITPLNTLKIIAASSIFGEPQYYKAGGVNDAKAVKNTVTMREYSILSSLFGGTKTAADVFTLAIDNALDYDFKGTLELAVELRKTYFMRLNPAVIYVRASIHTKREEFNLSNPGVMKSVGKAIAFRPDDLTNQFEYFMYLNGSKKGLSSLLKRTWADKLKEFSRYQLNKYKGKRLIDLVRISHANSPDIDELMRTGTLEITETEQTWEIMRSAGKSWKDILETIDMPHMALLRNLRGIFTEIKDLESAKEILQALKDGVIKGKQFPFRYFSAYRAIEQDNSVNHKTLIKDALEDCMDISVSNMPKLAGKTICLSDNSGSAWGSFNSDYGTVTVAEIANLSSLITAMQSDEGEIGLFGDRLVVEGVSKRTGLLKQHADVNLIEKRDRRIGGGTENGIWLFFDDAIRNRKHYDNIFIYSDMQAGHGNLYGIDASKYAKYLHKNHGGTRYIDVLALAQKYRDTVNPKVNLFTVQVAGYDNTVLPENLYRGAILAGWTGKEPIFAKAVIDTWNQIESK